MKESAIRAKVVAELEKGGWKCWWPAKVKYKENDIFTCFDIVAVQSGTHEMKWIQLTTYSNIAARRKKITDTFKLYDFVIKNAEVWGWNKTKGEFKIVKLT